MSQCVAILAPAGRDATVIQSIVESAGIDCLVCSSIDEALSALDAALAGMIILTEEVLDREGLSEFQNWVNHQPPWSDVPIVLLTRHREMTAAQIRIAENLGNVTMLERPLHPVTLVSGIKAGLRARKRQRAAETYIAELADKQLQIAEERDRARGYLDVAGVMLLVLDERGRIQEINPKGLEILGWDDVRQLAGKDWFDTALWPAEHDHYRSEFVKLLDGSSERTADEYDIVRKDGSSRCVRWKHVVLRDKAGRPSGLLSSGEDVTEQRAAEDRLQISERRYQTLFNSIDEGFCVIEFLDGPHGPLSDYIHVEANPAYERHAGIPNVVGQKVRDMVPDEAEGWVELYGDVLRTGKPIRFERELVATRRHLELAAFRVDPPGRRQVAVLFQDITARKRAEEQLRLLNQTLETRIEAALNERKLLADLVEGTDAFVHVADRDFRWLAINKAAKDEFERVFGIRPRVGMSMLDALDHLPEQREQVRAIWSRALDGEEFTVTAEFGDPDRDRRHYEMKFNVLRDATGQQIGAYEFVYDVTQRLRDQASLAEATARVHEMAKLETLGQLTGGVAHDFNNLLTPIVGALDTLRRRYDSDQRSVRLISGALQAAERATTLVQRLLTFARRQHLEDRPVNISSLIEGMQDLLRRSIGPHVTVRTEIRLPKAVARVDPNQLELAILNLAVNARDAMPDGGTLTISVEDGIISTDREDGLNPGRYVRLRVSDTGRGMAPDVLKRAIEPFFTTKGQGKGTGLGLSMVHGLAAQSGGALRLASHIGEGTTAELWLPLSQETVEEQARLRTETPGTGRRAKVLLVDDEELVRSATAEMLRDQGHEVIETGSPSAALAYLHSDASFDLLITDHVMPQMRGSVLAAESYRLRPNLPVLLITGYASLTEVEDVNVPRLAKPFRASDLQYEVARLIA